MHHQHRQSPTSPAWPHTDASVGATTPRESTAMHTGSLDVDIPGCVALASMHGELQALQSGEVFQNTS
jgi:hypothetical protein